MLSMTQLPFSGCGLLHCRLAMELSIRTSWGAVQGVSSSLYVYQEVLEGCNELVRAEEYSGLGQVHRALIPEPDERHCWGSRMLGPSQAGSKHCSRPAGLLCSWASSAFMPCCWIAPGPH